MQFSKDGHDMNHYTASAVGMVLVMMFILATQ
jgi:hypothetical protein